MKVTILGTKKYWFVESLVSILMKITGWDAIKAKQFLQNYESVYFDKRDSAFAKTLIDDLESAGFELALKEERGELKITISSSYANELDMLRKEVSALSGRINQLEQSKPQVASGASLKRGAVYERLTKESVRSASAPLSKTGTGMRENVFSESKSAISESSIGKYWLSRVGVLSLVLGVVFFLGYTFQYMGALGKISIGLLIGAMLVFSGNLLSAREGFFKWAMGILGGGWAILYFTIFAAYQIPETKIIDQPFVAFICLILVAFASIAHSFKFKSPTFVFFSYFLAYVAMASGDVTIYTLFATLILGVSALIVTKKFGWSWLALLSCAALYVTHWFWIEPSIYHMREHFAGQERLTEAVFLPLIGNEWRIYPLIATKQSFLHQAFLATYWVLFLVIGFFPKLKDEKTDPKNTQIDFSLLLLNSAVFCASFLHHLHVYYPDYKHIFTLVMALIFACLSFTKMKIGKGLLSDLYLAFSVSMMTIAVPMYFDGPYITYGWAAGAALLAWIGLKHDRLILRQSAWVLGALALIRLFIFDYTEKVVLFRALDLIQMSLFIYLAVSLSFFLIFIFYTFYGETDSKESRIAQNTFLILALVALTSGITVGGALSFASLSGVLSAGLLLRVGIARDRKSLRIASMIFLMMSIVRILSADSEYEISRFTINHYESFRVIFTILDITLVFAFAEWLRRHLQKTADIERLFFPVTTYACAVLVLNFFAQDNLDAWLSMIWGAFATLFVIGGFAVRERIYRWAGLGMFGCVLLRLFLHDFAKLQTIFRIVSFMGLGGVLIAVSLIYSAYAKRMTE